MHCTVLLSISNNIFSCFVIIFLSLTITIFILYFNLFDFIFILYSGVTVVAVYLFKRHLFVLSRCRQYECFLDIFKHNFRRIFLCFYYILYLHQGYVKGILSCCCRYNNIMISHKCHCYF